MLPQNQCLHTTPKPQQAHIAEKYKMNNAKAADAINSSFIFILNSV